jgi:hypothetical protein
MGYEVLRTPSRGVASKLRGPKRRLKNYRDIIFSLTVLNVPGLAAGVWICVGSGRQRPCRLERAVWLGSQQIDANPILQEKLCCVIVKTPYLPVDMGDSIGVCGKGGVYCTTLLPPPPQIQDFNMG